MSLVPRNKPLLQRRKSLKTTFQVFLDGLISVVSIYLTISYFQGLFTSLDAVFLVSLLTIMAVSYDQMGIYRKNLNLWNAAKKQFIAWSLSFTITLTFFILAGYIHQISYAALAMIFAITFSSHMLNRILFIWFAERTSNTAKKQTKVLLIGDGPLAEDVFQTINNNKWIQEKAIGCICLSQVSTHSRIPVLGVFDDLLQIVEENNIRAVYIVVSLKNAAMVEQTYKALMNVNIDIHWIPNIFTMDLINHNVKEMNGMPLLTLSESPLIGDHLLFKSIEDKVIATLMIIVLSPVMLITALIVKLESPGPIIFKQRRTGWEGKIFYIWKFRSMKMHSDQGGEVKQATKDDDRFTRSGKFIRRTSIDELPQLFNVLSGTMSLVGPRPHAVEHNIKYAQHINAYLARHRIKPGITGLAQINGFRGETETIEKMKKRVDYDLKYINNWSFWLDIEILIKTPISLVSKNIY